MPEHFSSYHKLFSILFLKENESTFQVMAMYRENADGLKYFRSAGLKCFDFCLLFPLVELEYRLKISSNSEQLLLCFVSIKTEYSCPRHSIHVALHKIRLNITPSPEKWYYACILMSHGVFGEKKGEEGGFRHLLYYSTSVE